MPFPDPGVTWYAARGLSRRDSRAPGLETHAEIRPGRFAALRTTMTIA